MKPPVVIVQAACAAMLASIGGNALSVPAAQRVGHYDFGYAIRGDRAARPAQVFDDGEGKVYFEVRPGQAMPAVFAGKDMELLVTQAEGQFFTARTGASEFTLALGRARATVMRGDAALGGETISVVPPTGAGRWIASADPGLPSGVMFDAPVPMAPRASAVDPSDLARSSYATPVRGDVIEWVEPGVAHTQPIVFAPGSAVLGAAVRGALGALAMRIGREAAIVIEGRGDASRKAGLAAARADALRGALVARGIPAANIGVQVLDEGDADAAASPGVAPATAIRWTSAARTHRASQSAGDPAVSTFDIQASDADIAGAVRRWARAAGFDVVWELDWTAPVTGRAHLDASTFLAAVEEVVAGLRAQGYPVRAQSYADHVVRFSASE